MVKGGVLSQPRGTSAAIRLRTIVGWRRPVLSGGRYVDLDTAPIQYRAFEVPLLWKGISNYSYPSSEAPCVLKENNRHGPRPIG